MQGDEKFKCLAQSEMLLKTSSDLSPVCNPGATEFIINSINIQKQSPKLRKNSSCVRYWLKFFKTNAKPKKNIGVKTKLELQENMKKKS